MCGRPPAASGHSGKLRYRILTTGRLRWPVFPFIERYRLDMKRIVIPVVILLSVAAAAAGQTAPGRGTTPPTTQPAPGQRGTPAPTTPPPLPTQQTPVKPAM